jgi:cytosine/adenosine deaminase-related metal-dependent hydrolase
MNAEMLLVIYNSSIDDEMMEALSRAGMTCYTKFMNLRGAGACSEPRLNTQVWPGTNSMLLVYAEPATRERLLGAVRAMKELHRKEGVTAFVVPVSQAV